MAVQYNPKKRTFRITYKDYVKVGLGKTYPYTSVIRHFGPSVVGLPTKAQIRQRTIELEAEVLRLEEQSKGGIPDCEITENREAPAILSTLLEKISKNATINGNEQSRNRAERTVLHFISWLKDKYPRLTVYGLTKKIILRYFKERLQHLMISTLKVRKAYLQTAYKKVLEVNDITTRNPFENISEVDLKAVCKAENKIIDLSVYDEDFITRFYSYIQATYKEDTELLLVYHLLISTGIRIGDILDLKNEQVDLIHRTITFIHSKTEKTTRAKSTIYITENTLRLLKGLHKKIQGKGRLFYLTKDTLRKKVRTILYKYFNTVEKPREYKETENRGKIYSSHNIHGFRRTFITLQKKYHTDGDIIRYIVGHTGNSIEERHYNIFSTDAKGFTEKPLMMMENIMTGKNTPNKEYTLTDILNTLGISIETLRKLVNTDYDKENT